METSLFSFAERHETKARAKNEKKKLSELHLTFQLNADLTIRIQMCTCGVFKVCLPFYECK